MRKKLFWIVPLIAGYAVTGCVYSHRPVVYSATTSDAALGATTTEVVTTPTTVVATSPRPAVRVYASPEPPKLSVTTPVPLPVTSTTVVPGHIVTTSSSSDAAVVAGIRQMLENDSARLYRNADFEVDSGRVTVRGTVPTDHDRIELQNRLVTMPGVASVENKLDVELH